MVAPPTSVRRGMLDAQVVNTGRPSKTRKWAETGIGPLTDRMQGIDAMGPIFAGSDGDLCFALPLKSAHRRCG